MHDSTDSNLASFREAVRIMGTVELRCGSTLFGRLTDNRYLEVKCKRRACGYAKGTITLHTIDIETGEVIRTRKFAEPRNKKGTQYDSGTPAAIRSA